MPLTHDEIAAMARDHDWSHAGRLLEMMGEYALSSNGTITEITAFTDKGDIDVTAPTAPEAIVRCWLKWWEVTHE